MNMTKEQREAIRARKDRILATFPYSVLADEMNELGEIVNVLLDALKESIEALLTPSGIIRRTDDLGRVAIPKEIRRRYGISEGDALEIYPINGCIMIKKYESLEV